MPEKRAKPNEISKETVNAAGNIDLKKQGRSAYEQLWRRADELQRELLSARLEYPGDERRIDRLSEERKRLLFKLLPYDNLQPVPTLSKPKIDLSKLSDNELRQLERITLKLNGDGLRSGEGQWTRPSEPKMHDAPAPTSRTADAPIRPRAAPNSQRSINRLKPGGKLYRT